MALLLERSNDFGFVNSRIDSKIRYPSERLSIHTDDDPTRTSGTQSDALLDVRKSSLWFVTAGAFSTYLSYSFLKLGL
jgi:hypothetical protein